MADQLVHFKGPYLDKTLCGKRNFNKSTQRKGDVTCPKCKSKIAAEREAYKDQGNFNPTDDKVGTAKRVITGEAAIKLIRRLVEQTIAELDETDDSMQAKSYYAPRAELVELISAMDPEEISDREYIDEDTGEICLSVGQSAADSVCYPRSDDQFVVNRDQDDYEIEDEDDLERDEKLEKVLASFENDFNVESGDLLEYVEDPDQMREMNYDVDLVIPRSIKRHDGRTFTQRDLDAVGKYIEAWTELTGKNANVSLFWNKKAGGTVIEVSPAFS